MCVFAAIGRKIRFSRTISFLGNLLFLRIMLKMLNSPPSVDGEFVRKCGKTSVRNRGNLCRVSRERLYLSKNVCKFAEVSLAICRRMMPR